MATNFVRYFDVPYVIRRCCEFGKYRIIGKSVYSLHANCFHKEAIKCAFNCEAEYVFLTSYDEIVLCLIKLGVGVC